MLDRVLRLRLRVLLVYIYDQQTKHRLRALQFETAPEQNAITTLGIQNKSAVYTSKSSPSKTRIESEDRRTSLAQ